MRSNQISMKGSARATRRALVSGEETAKALAIAKRNAEAATAQSKIARETFEAQNRPWLFVKAVEIHFEHMESAIVSVRLWNYETMPAGRGCRRRTACWSCVQCNAAGFAHARHCAAVKSRVRSVPSTT